MLFIFFIYVFSSLLISSDSFCVLDKIDSLDDSANREYYNIGDTISEEDQLYNYDVCYSDGNYDFGSTFNLGDFSGNIILISMNATW